jgi:hypothetical protein
MAKRFGYSENLPEDIRVIFIWLCQDVVSLSEKWRLYLGLFSDPEVASLLSDMARGTFQIIRESLQNDMTLAIARLCDPAHSFEHEHVSLEALASRATHIDQLDQKVNDFIRLCKPVRDLRNMRVGHNDLKALIDPHDNPLPGISRSLIDQIVAEASAILSYVLHQYEDSELVFEFQTVGGADLLIHWLRIAKKHEEEERNARLGSSA